MHQWAVNLIFCVLTLILLGYISPEGQFEKQLRLVYSVLFVVAVFIPVVEYIRGDRYNESFLKTSLYIDAQYLENQYALSHNAYEEMLVTTYKQDLEEALLKELLKKDSSFDGKVNIQIDKDATSETFGIVTSVEVTPQGDTHDPSDIKKVINNFYSVDEENIYILGLEESE